MSPSEAAKKAWARPRSRERMVAARRNLYFTRYPWIPVDRHDEMRALVKKVGRAAAEAAMRESL